MGKAKINKINMNWKYNYVDFDDTDSITDYFHSYTLPINESIDWVKRDGADVIDVQSCNGDDSPKYHKRIEKLARLAGYNLDVEYRTGTYEGGRSWKKPRWTLTKKTVSTSGDSPETLNITQEISEPETVQEDQSPSDAVLLSQSQFHERRESRIERYKQYAENAKDRSNAARERSDSYTRFIPFGQPILVGHHSEKRHRNALKKSDNAMRKCIAESGKAEYWAGRAEAAENNNTIFKQDPEAVQKLKEKIAELEHRQERMKLINKTLRSGDQSKIDALTLSEKERKDLVCHQKFDVIHCVGFPGYALRCNGANLRRYKERLERLQKEQSRDEISESLPGNVDISENPEFCSIEMRFPGKPSEVIRDRLKSHGFRWAGRSKCWYKKRRDDYHLEIARSIAAQFADEISA